MSDFFGRIVNLVKGAAENLLSDLEKDNPEAVIEASLDALSKRHQELSGVIATQSRRVEQSRRELERLELDRDNLAEEASLLAKEDNDQRALEVVEGKQRLDERIVVLRDELGLQEDLLAESQRNQAELEQQLKGLKKEKDKLLADHHILGAAAERESLAQGVPQSAAFQAIQNVRDQLARAEGVLEKSATQKADTAADRRARAVAELEALKKGGKADSASAGASPVSRTLDGPSAESSAPASPPAEPGDALPKRTL